MYMKNDRFIAPRITSRITYGLLRLISWDTDISVVEAERGFVFAVFPHNSNFDAVLGYLTFKTAGLRAATLAKSELFRFPLGIVMRALGGIPVNRSQHSDMVSEMVSHFKKTPGFVLAIAPEGTRKKTSSIKSGFWYIAKGAGVNIHLLYFDKQNRRIRRLDIFTPGESFEEDIILISDIYRKAGYTIPLASKLSQAPFCTVESASE